LLLFKVSIITATHWFWDFRWWCTFSFNMITHDTYRIVQEQLASWIWLQMRCWHIGSEIGGTKICMSLL
jgi:hypothetical protein